MWAKSVEFYAFTVNSSYEEFDSRGNFVDGDYSDYGELNGIGVKLNSKNGVYYYLKGEFSYGSGTYNGSTWGGVPLIVKKDDVFLLSFEGGFFPYNTPFYISLGYRYWNRGESGYPGDYNEKYYWPYFGVGYHYLLKFGKFYFSTDVGYQYALNPLLKAELAGGIVLHLYDTEGLKFEAEAYFKIEENLMISFMYRYQFWHIGGSASENVLLNSQNVQVYEPESYTRNQYIGAGVLYKF